MKSLSLRSDLMVMGDRSHVVDHGPYWSMTTPSEPDFWYGNQIIVKDHRLSRTQAVAWFARHFPDAGHCVISFDTPGLSDQDISPDFRKDGFEPEICDTLQRIGAPDVSGWDVTQASDQDWRALLDLSQQSAAEQGFDPAQHAGFLEKRQATYRHRIAQGAGAWLVVRDDSGIIGQAGIFCEGGLSRFQSVDTRKDRRKQGVASALVAAGCRIAAARAPGDPATIVAETGSAAARLYTALGFTLAETSLSVCRASY